MMNRESDLLEWYYDSITSDELREAYVKKFEKNMKNTRMHISV